mgnify:FL=1
MKVLHLLATGGTGGIEVLCKDIFLRSNFDNRICCLFDEGEIFKSLSEESEKIFSLKKYNKNINKIVKYLVKYCINEKIEIITVHHGGLSCNLIYIMLKKRLPNLKYVRYLHACFDQYAFGNDKGIFNRILVRTMMQKAFNCSDLIFISKAVEKSFDTKFNIKSKKKVVIYNGISENFFSEEKFSIDKNGKINIIFVGRLSYVKGVDLLIRAFSDIKKENVYLTIVGDGDEKEKLVNIAEDLKVNNRIKFVGRQSNVIKWLDKADIFVYPSIWEEGFGISVVEAMARGCIPITFKSGGLPEIIENNKNGILVDEINVEKLASAIEQIIIMDKDEKIKLINSAKATAIKFSINNTLDKLRNEYTNLINSNE